MNKISSYRSQKSASSDPHGLLKQRSLIFGLILLLALLGFEMFNYSTTEFALVDILGEIRFVGIPWATILALAFCGIDFAGIAQLFLPENSQETGRETWFLFGAWLLAASLNAMLTWWGVSIALTNHAISSSSFVGPDVLGKAVPIFIAVMVWVTRILLISSFSSSGMRVFALFDEPNQRIEQPSQAVARPRSTSAQHIPTGNPVASYANSRSSSAQREQPAQHRPVSTRRESPAQSRPMVANPRPVIPSRPLPQPAPKPNSMPRPDDQSDDGLPPEPEYIPDPTFSLPQSAYHSLTAKSGGAAPQSKRF